MIPSQVRIPLQVQGEDECHGWPTPGFLSNLPQGVLGGGTGESAPQDGVSPFGAAITIGAAGP